MISSRRGITQVLDLLSEEPQSACFLLRLDREILYLNDSAAQLYGWGKGQVIGKNFSLLCQSQNIEDVSLKYLPDEDFNAPITGITHDLKLKNSPPTIVEWNFFPIKEDSNKTINILMIGVDIRKNLQDKNSYLYNIMNNVPHTIFWKNRESVFLGCNEAFAKLAQVNSPEDIVGLTDYDLPWKKSESNAYRADDQAVMNADQPKLNIEENQTLADGKKIVLLTSKVPLHDKQGRVNGVLGVYTDITAQKEMEQKLEKAHEAEEELKKVKYQLEGAKLISGSIAHEIRTPLATIKSATYGLENTLSTLISMNQIVFKKSLDIETITDQEIENARKAISSINKKVDQSNVIINMLLTKLQSIDFEFAEFSICSASDCVQTAINEFKLFDSTFHKINFNAKNDFKFLGNLTLVVHVIMNLLKNAVFYIQKASKGEITIWLTQAEKVNQIHFKDTGTGISPEILPHVFDSFFTTESSTGTGVGLAFSKMVMQSHNGEINCLSKEGEYTEFILSFSKMDNQ